MPEVHYAPLISAVDSEESKILLYKSGRIATELYGRYTFSCEMDLTYFPFDHQFCVIMTSAGNLDIQYKNPFRMAPNQSTANFVVQDLDFIVDYNSRFLQTNVDFATEWKHWIRIRMSRKHEVFLTTLLLPNLTLTVLSWAVFWIGADKLPERVSICIALILAQLILIVGEEQEFPNTSDFKLVDLYLFVNFFINVASLLETILASFCSKASSRKRCRSCLRSEKTGKRDRIDLPTIQVTGPEESTTTKTTIGQPSLVNCVDLISKILFPLLFIAWNIVFFRLAEKSAEIARNVGRVQQMEFAA
ncbi:glycine receptor subunit alpha-2-like [Convolutriloba macropyga]|uniref:glycine receptor subunit alpha-2-like n=1 Tax=Convolutriloba macropyga TaxID=536237 RepID=UPI003F51F84C